MRALRLCHTTSQWRGTAAELHGCGVNVTTVLLLVSQHIDRVAWGSSADTKSGSRAHSLVVHHHVICFQRQRTPADPWNSGFRANTPRRSWGVRYSWLKCKPQPAHKMRR